MNKCLVTKFNGTVDNDSLLHVGETVVSVLSDEANKSILQIGYNGEYSCDHRHMLGSDTIEPNVRNTMSNWKDFKSIEKGTYKINLYDKYNVYGLLFKGDVSEVKQFEWLTNCTQLIGNFIDEAHFDISNLVNFNDFTILTLSGNITGDIASLKNNTGLTSITLSGNHSVIIKAESLSDKIKTINCGSYYNKDFGDISVICPELSYFFLGRGVDVKWTSRPSSYKTIAMFGFPNVDNVDKMLQDQANCQTGITSSTPEFMKQISATGTRTSASDAAVATLQSKGYTVSISPA